MKLKILLFLPFLVLIFADKIFAQEKSTIKTNEKKSTKKANVSILKC
jgi:hypothetical protein